MQFDEGDGVDAEASHEDVQVSLSARWDIFPSGCRGSPGRASRGSALWGITHSGSVALCTLHSVIDGRRGRGVAVVDDSVLVTYTSLIAV
jgi:hypothetical protein